MRINYIYDVYHINVFIFYFIYIQIKYGCANPSQYIRIPLINMVPWSTHASVEELEVVGIQLSISGL